MAIQQLDGASRENFGAGRARDRRANRRIARAKARRCRVSRRHNYPPRFPLSELSPPAAIAIAARHAARTLTDWF